MLLPSVAVATVFIRPVVVYQVSYEGDMIEIRIVYIKYLDYVK